MEWDRTNRGILSTSNFYFKSDILRHKACPVSANKCPAVFCSSSRLDFARLPSGPVRDQINELGCMELAPRMQADPTKRDAPLVRVYNFLREFSSFDTLTRTTNKPPPCRNTCPQLPARSPSPPSSTRFCYHLRRALLTLNRSLFPSFSLPGPAMLRSNFTAAP
jgi:hypothetical protein